MPPSEHAGMHNRPPLRPTPRRDGSTDRRVLIVGGVAGGASCAARLRRLDETVEIAIFDRGPYVSFANCGLPYFVGNVIADERALLVASTDTFRERFLQHLIDPLRFVVGVQEQV